MNDSGKILSLAGSAVREGDKQLATAKHAKVLMLIIVCFRKSNRVIIFGYFLSNIKQ